MSLREHITLVVVALLSLLPLLLHQQSALVDAKLTHLHHRPGHRQSLQPHRLTRQRGGWLAGDRWCRNAGLGGLAKLSGSGDDEEADRLAERASVLPVGCYWVAATSPDDVTWLLDNPGRSPKHGGCICVLTGDGSGSKNPRLHLSNCHRQLPFLCQLTSPPVTTTKSSLAATSAASVASTKKSTDTHGGIEFMSDEAPADPDEEESGAMDQTVDHGKFLMVPNLGGAASKSPDGHPFGWLPPWRSSPTAKPPAVTSPDPSRVLKLVDVNATSSVDQGGLRMLMEGQRSEFVTLIVLYTIVGVVCCVLLALCFIRCFRGYCGKSRIRYVKQVDADYIPRFMPSSWA